MGDIRVILLNWFLIGQVSCWFNLFDQPFTFTCPNQETLHHVQSIHSNNNEDREWEFSCRAPPSDATLTNCEWTNYSNEFDLPLTFQCPSDGVISGVSSYHDNDKEDRRFKFYCCEMPGYVTASCFLTAYINDFDLPLDYYVPDGQVMRGVDSYHDNDKEDRRFKFEVCDVLAKQ